MSLKALAKKSLAGKYTRSNLPSKRNQGGVTHADTPLTGLGVGLRGPHVPDILRQQPAVPWFELLTDNHLCAGGALRFQAEAIAERYPVALHGVNLSLGGVDPLDRAYLGQVRDLARRVDARHVSEHLAFTARDGIHTHDLLPLPWTEEALRHVADRVDQVQDFLGQHILVENISTYLEYTHSTLSEGDFLSALCAQTGCGLLLDINNVYVNAVNHDHDPQVLLDAMPWTRVREIHLAGHEERDGLLLDTHGGVVCAEVLDLFLRVAPRVPEVPVLFEWDTSLPRWSVVWQEAQRLEQAYQRAFA